MNYCFFIEDFLVMVAIKFKKNIASVCVFYIIIDKFGYWQKSSSVVLFVINKYLIISFYITILLFSLAINLE